VSTPGLVLAAGEGRRFGGPKQLASLAGRPLLEHVVTAARAVLDPVVVVLGAHAADVRAGVVLGGARVVICEDWAEGMSASLRCGLRALREVDAVMVVLGDQPLITPEVMRAVLAAGAPARAAYDGVPGHPVLLDAALVAGAGSLRGDAGFRARLAGVTLVECGELCDPTDIDTRADLEVVRR
jgi:CTP:molybdopterin cytidylyltransferase MocA